MKKISRSEWWWQRPERERDEQMTRDGKIIRFDGYPIRNPNFWIYRTRIFGFGFGYGFDFCTRNFLDLDMDMTSTDPKPDPKPEILSEPDPNPKPEKNPNIIYIL